VGDRDIARRVARPLPERAHIDAEAFADAALGVFNFVIHLARGEVHEFRRQIGNERLEAQARLEFRVGAGVRAAIVSGSKIQFDARLKEVQVAVRGATAHLAEAVVEPPLHVGVQIPVHPTMNMDRRPPLMLPLLRSRNE